MDETDVVPGGAHVVLRWVQALEFTEAPRILWTSLDDNLRLVLAQQWLMGPGAHYRCDELSARDELAANLSRAAGEQQLFGSMIANYLAHWRTVYADLDYRPALIGLRDPVGVDLEFVAVTSEAYVGKKKAGESIPAHSFLTRLVAGEWFIAAQARRLPRPGWPPTEEIIPGLRVDGG